MPTSLHKLHIADAAYQKSSVFLVVKPSKIILLKENTIPQKEDRILLYIGYHGTPK